MKGIKWTQAFICVVTAITAQGMAVQLSTTDNLALGTETAPQWTVVEPSQDEIAPVARQESLLAYWEAQNKLVLYGGKDSSNDNVLGDVWTFDLETFLWAQLSTPESSSPKPRFSLAGGLANNTLIIFGGESTNGVILNDIWGLDLVTVSWTMLHNGNDGVTPLPRYGHAGGVVTLPSGPVFVTSHGFDKADRYKDSFLFDLNSNQWTDVTPKSGEIPTARCLVAGAATLGSSNEVLLGMYGGCGSGGYGPCPSSEMWVLNISTIELPSFDSEWKMAPRCVRARVYGAMAADASIGGGSFFLYGGTGAPLVSQDSPGQLNSISMQNFAWTQSELEGNSLPGQPSGNKQSAMVSTSAKTLYLQVGATNTIYALNYSSLQSFSNFDDQECHSDPVPGWRTAHGVFMGLSWGFLLPIGVFIARFGRIKDPLWFKIHRAVQMTGVTLSIVGFIAAMLMVSTGKFLAVPHSFIGIAVTVLGIQQPLNAYFRPHAPKGEPKARSRIAWEYWHKYSGRVALVLGLINPFWGIYYLAGIGGGFYVYAVWVGIYVLAFVYLTARGLPYEANGPSALADWINRFLCCCLTPWDDSFRSRTRAVKANSGGMSGTTTAENVEEGVKNQ